MAFSTARPPPDDDDDDAVYDTVAVAKPVDTVAVAKPDADAKPSSVSLSRRSTPELPSAIGRVDTATPMKGLDAWISDTDGGCVFFMLHTAVSLLFNATYARLVTREHLNMLIDVVLQKKKNDSRHPSNHARHTVEWTRDMIGTDNESYCDEVWIFFLDMMFGKDIVARRKVNDLKELLPSPSSGMGEQCSKVFMTQVTMNNQKDSIYGEAENINETTPVDDLQHMTLFVPEYDCFYDSFYLLQPGSSTLRSYNKLSKKEKKDSRFFRHCESKLTPKRMSGEFAQHTDGQISRSREGSGVGVHRFVKVKRRLKRINRAYELSKRGDPVIDPDEMKQRFLAKVELRLKSAPAAAPAAVPDATDPDAADHEPVATQPMRLPKDVMKKVYVFAAAYLSARPRKGKAKGMAATAATAVRDDDDNDEDFDTEMHDAEPPPRRCVSLIN